MENFGKLNNLNGCLFRMILFNEPIKLITSIFHCNTIDIDIYYKYVHTSYIYNIESRNSKPSFYFLRHKYAENVFMQIAMCSVSVLCMYSCREYINGVRECEFQVDKIILQSFDLITQNININNLNSHSHL